MTPISTLFYTTIWDGLKYVMMALGGQYFLELKAAVTNSTHKRHKPKSKRTNKKKPDVLTLKIQIYKPANLLLTFNLLFFLLF